MIEGSEKRICRSTFEFYSPHVIEKRNKLEWPKNKSFYVSVYEQYGHEDNEMLKTVLNFFSK